MIPMRNLFPLVSLLVALACAQPRQIPAVATVGDTMRLPLTVASDLNNPPFATTNDQGIPYGRDVEMMARIATTLGRPLHWKTMPFEELLESVADSEVDIVCATLGVTPERSRQVLFTRPYFFTELALVVRKGAGEPQSLDDLAGRRVAASEGTTSERAIRLYLTSSTGVFISEGEPSPVEQLLLGEVDALVMDRPAAEILLAQGEGSFQRLPRPIAPEHYALAVRPDAESLRIRLNQALSQLDDEGYLAELDRRYGLISTP